MRTRIGVTVVLAVLSGSAASRAQSNQAVAEALFDEGKKLMAQGQFAQACPKLAESQRLDPAAGTLLNLAACYERAGQNASAWITYKETISVAERSGRKEWAAAAGKKAAALEPTLSKITIVVAPAARVTGLVVKRDGVTTSSAEWGIAIPLDPGKHVVEASAPDKKTWTMNLELGPKSDLQTVNVPALDSPGASTTPPTTPVNGITTTPTTSPPTADTRSGGSSLRLVGLGLAGVGVIGVGVGALFGLSASTSFDDAKPDCNADQSLCNSNGLAKIDDAKSAATLSTIGFIAGGALIAGGLVLFLTAKKPETTTAKRTVVVPFGGAGPGLSLHATW